MQRLAELDAQQALAFAAPQADPGPPAPAL